MIHLHIYFGISTTPPLVTGSDYPGNFNYVFHTLKVYIFRLLFVGFSACSVYQFFAVIRPNIIITSSFKIVVFNSNSKQYKIIPRKDL